MGLIDTPTVAIVFDPLPLQQGLRPTEFSQYVAAPGVFDPLPLQQGLRQISVDFKVGFPIVFDPLPLQQGLRRAFHFPNSLRSSPVFDPLPLQQGLRPAQMPARQVYARSL